MSKFTMTKIFRQIFWGINMGRPHLTFLGGPSPSPAKSPPMATSDRPLRFYDRHDLLLTQSRTALSHSTAA